MSNSPGCQPLNPFDNLKPVLQSDYSTAGRLCMCRFAPLILPVFLIGTIAAAYEPGEQLVVARGVEMKTVTGSMFRLTPGTAVTVRGVEGDKLKVAAPRVGWIDSSAAI